MSPTDSVSSVNTLSLPAILVAILKGIYTVPRRLRVRQQYKVIQDTAPSPLKEEKQTPHLLQVVAW